MGRVAVVLGLVVFSGALSGCVEHCVAGETIACACTDGRAGRQVCGGLGNFQPCACKSPPDAGLPEVDAGTCFTTSRFSVGLNPPLRLAVGASATVQASSLSTRDPLRYRWTMHGEPVDAGPTYSQSALSVAFDRPGTWWVEADVTSLDFGNCQVGHGRGGLLTVVPSTTLPFAVVDATCCDGEGHGYVVSDGPPTLWRLDGDRVSAPTLLARRPKRLALSDDGSVLFVGQDAYISTYRLPSMELQWALPINGIVGGLTGTAQDAWLFTGSNATRLDLDAGTLTTQGNFNQWNSSPITDAVIASDGSLVIEHNGYLQRVPVSAGFLGAPRFSVVRTCGNLWAVKGHRELFVACGEAYEPAPDGGFTYVGVYDESRDWVRALGLGGEGRLAAVNGDERSHQVGLLRAVSMETFQSLETREVGLWSSANDTHLLPRWVLTRPDAGVSTLTPVPSLNLTWVELLP